MSLKKVLLWTGRSLLAISAVFWFLIILGIVTNPEANSYAPLIGGGVTISTIPIVLGIYLVVRYSKER